MVSKRADEQRRELGEFVRAHRERLTPAAIGVPSGARRRTPGLRREEVAQLCGLSTTWYTWIEQGRDVSASPESLARLAGVLRLSRAERSYLFDLAGRRDPEPVGGHSGHVPPAVLACVETIAAPAYILDRTWSALSWNASAARLFVGWLDRSGETNLLRFIFLRPGARSLICDWEVRARRVAAEFRAASSAYHDDPALRALIGELRERSPEFAWFWQQHGVLEREGGERTFNHPKDGFLRYQQVTFDLASQTDLKLTILIEVKGGTGRAAARRGGRRSRTPSQ
jgi:transcriptional regulator with XRE-family HTH domain